MNINRYYFNIFGDGDFLLCSAEGNRLYFLGVDLFCQIGEMPPNTWEYNGSNLKRFSYGAKMKGKDRLPSAAHSGELLCACQSTGRAVYLFGNGAAILIENRKGERTRTLPFAIRFLSPRQAKKNGFARGDLDARADWRPLPLQQEDEWRQSPYPMQPVEIIRPGLNPVEQAAAWHGLPLCLPANAQRLDIVWQPCDRKAFPNENRLMDRLPRLIGEKLHARFDDSKWKSRRPGNGVEAGVLPFLIGNECVAELIYGLPCNYPAYCSDEHEILTLRYARKLEGEVEAMLRELLAKHRHAKAIDGKMIFKSAARQNLFLIRGMAFVSAWFLLAAALAWNFMQPETRLSKPGFFTMAFLLIAIPLTAAWELADAMKAGWQSIPRPVKIAFILWLPLLLAACMLALRFLLLRSGNA